MTKILRYIGVDDESRREIEAEVGCSYQHTYLALRNLRGGDKATQIRELAMAKGGELRVDAPQSAAIIKSDGENGEDWELSLDNGVLVRFAFRTGSVSLSREGKDIAVYPNPDTKSIYGILTYAANL